jgi:S1-C subfamily serine protease
MTTCSRRLVGLIAVLPLALIAPVVTAADDDGEKEYQKLLADKAPAMVTLKFVLKMKMGQFGDNESERESTAVMIDPTGLVLCSNTELGGVGGLMGRMMSGRFGGSITPSDIKVLIGEDTQGLEAELMARDSELDLAWVRIKDPAGKKFAFVDLSKSAKPRLGQRALTVERMGKYFDRTPRVGEMRISAIARKPRELYMPGGEQVTPGLPVFTVSGEVIGIGVFQSPASDESSDSGAMDFSSVSDALPLILPAEEVLKATARAKENPKGADEDGDAKAKQNRDD